MQTGNDANKPEIEYAQMYNRSRIAVYLIIFITNVLELRSGFPRSKQTDVYKYCIAEYSSFLGQPAYVAFPKLPKGFSLNPTNQMRITPPPTWSFN